MRVPLMFSLMLLATGCERAAANEFLASELIYAGVDHGWSRTVTLDPWLSKHPDIARAIMREELQKYASANDDCSNADGTPGCFEYRSFKVVYSGSRLLSVEEDIQVDTGGAHPSTAQKGHFYDLAVGKEIAFRDLFVRWETARPALQRRFCEALREQRPTVSTCPDLTEQGLNAVRGKILVTTQEYELGSYSDGSETVLIWVDDDLMRGSKIAEMLKPEFRSDLSDPTFTSG